MRKTILSGGEETENKTAGIINHRETEQVLLQARKAADVYEAAADCSVIVLDSSGLPADGTVREVSFCKLCKQSWADFPESGGKYFYLCTSTHLEAIREAKPEGSSYVYACEKGIAFWISPFYSGGRYVGAFLAGKVRITDAHGQFGCVNNGSSPPPETISQCYEDIPRKSHSEIDALSRLLLACAVSVSENPEDPEAGIDSGEALFQSGIQDRRKGQGEKENAYPLDRERFLLASLRRGDTDTARRVLKELLDMVQPAGAGGFEFIRFRALELVVLLSRAAAGGENDGTIFEANNRYLRRIQESKTTEELLDNMHHIVDLLSEHIFSFQGIRHASALRKAERFIWTNYTRRISLGEIAEASGLSPSYFSTVFKNEMGENLSAYLNRLRVEKAAMMLTETKRSLTDIAEACGFENRSWFSRIFRHHAGISPGKYRERGGSLNDLRNKPNV
jgi:AraC-like DNA-binding protein/ligand-binding sensor protein